ncbi:MAG: T9SS type A sorting domain-containing protein, partial [bacterium]
IFKHGAAPSSDWSTLGFNASAWDTVKPNGWDYEWGLRPFHRAYGETFSTLPNAIYFRNIVNITNISEIKLLISGVSTSENWQVFLNGTEIVPLTSPTYKNSWGATRRKSFDQYYEASGISALLEGNNVIGVKLTPTGDNTTIDFGMDFRVIRQGRELLRRGPVLVNQKTDGIQIRWWTFVPTTGKVDYGLDGFIHNQVSSQSSGGTSILHDAVLTGLKPDKLYQYRVEAIYNDSSYFFPQTTFPTKPAVKRPTRFFVYGDNRASSQRTWDQTVHYQVIRQMLSVDPYPEYVVHLGDYHTTGGGRCNDIMEQEFFRPAQDFLAKTPIYPIRGNHEESIDWFDPQFAGAGENGGGYYDFDFGYVHWIGIDYGDHTKDNLQYSFLKDGLGNSVQPWKFTFAHFGLACSYQGKMDSWEGFRTVYKPLYDESDVDIVWGACFHYYERIKWPDKDYYHIISGGGGADLYGAWDPYQYSQVAKKSFHFCVLDLDDANLHLQVIDKDGSVIDSLNLTKSHSRFYREQTTNENNNPLLAAYPNPFSKSIKVTVSLKTGSDINLYLYNVRGQLVNTLITERNKAGNYNISWNGCDGKGEKMQAGVYFLRLKSGNGILQKQVIFLR